MDVYRKPTHTDRFLFYILPRQETSNRLRSHDIQVTNKLNKSSAPEFRPSEEDQCNVVYKIPYASCPLTYTGRPEDLSKLGEKNTPEIFVYQCSKRSNVANHAWPQSHNIDFDIASVIGKGNFRKRKTIESWRATPAFF